MLLCLHHQQLVVMCRQLWLQVATYVSILDRDLGDRKKTAEVDVTALLKSSYSSLIALETEKRLKSVPVAFYPTPPQQLFPEVCKIDFPGWVL